MRQNGLNSTSEESEINQQGFISIGGIEQWISIQGNNAENPVILFLHGGPGEAQSPLLKEFHPWEEVFTVINWDQRGSGKTYGKHGNTTSGMTIEQITQDAIELAEYACNYLNTSKLILIGHSWGSLLGLHVTKRKPELFSVFIGTGQLVNWELNLLDRERWTRKKAIEEGDEQILRNLDETADLPADNEKRIIASNKYRMSASDFEYVKVIEDFVGQPLTSSIENMKGTVHGDVNDWLAGAGFSQTKLVPEVFSADARALGMEFPLPFFIIQGKDDHTTSCNIAEAYLEEVQAPQKAFITIDGGHFACFTNPEEFITILNKRVLPLVEPK